MESLYLLIPLSVMVVFIALWVFFRAMDSGQFDDLEGPGLRILQDDDRAHADAADLFDDSKKQDQRSIPPQCVRMRQGCTTSGLEKSKT